MLSLSSILSEGSDSVLNSVLWFTQFGINTIEVYESEALPRFAAQTAIFQPTEPPMTGFHQQYAFNDNGSFTAQFQSSF